MKVFERVSVGFQMSALHCYSETLVSQAVTSLINPLNHYTEFNSNYVLYMKQITF